MVVFHELGDFLRKAQLLIYVSNLYDSTDYYFQRAYFRLLNFIKVVHNPNDVVFLKGIGD